MDYKFFGVPIQRDQTNPRTDFAKGKNYRDKIEGTYSLFGIKPDEVTRVICYWVFPEPEAEQTVWEQSPAHGFPLKQLELLSFRDHVIPELQKMIGRSNYDDEILRTFSLLAQYEKQTSLKGQR